jgi:hypothetical protein
MRHIVLYLLLAVSGWAAELPHTTATIPELFTRDRARYTNVTVTKCDQGQVSFRYDDGVTTRPLAAFDDASIERIIPGYLADLKAKQAAAGAREQEQERTRDAQRKQAPERNPAAAAQARKEDDIREAALRHVMTHFEAPDLTKVSGVIILVDRDPTSDEFMTRFATDKPPVRKIPRSKRRELLETELSCTVSALKWLSGIEAEISVSRVIGEAAVDFRYSVRLTSKGWEIVQSRTTFIS